MPNLFLVPSEWLSFFSIIGALLVFFTVKKVRILTRSSAVKMFILGLVLIGVSLLGFGVLYGIFSDQNIPIEIRQFAVRTSILSMLLVIDAWQAIILIWGDTL